MRPHTGRRTLTAALLLGSLASTLNAFTHPSQYVLNPNSGRYRPFRRTCNSLSLSSKPWKRVTGTSLSLASSKDTKGIYSRPSAAIERGSGFFIPGLEGPRVRLVFGIVVLVLTVLNHVLLSSDLPAVAFLERLALVYAILLLLQAAIEFGKEEKGYVVKLDRTESASPSYSQTWSSSGSALSDDDKETIEWAAASYVALTPATHMLLLGRNDGIVYRLGVTSPSLVDSQNELQGTTAAFVALDKASSGRVSLSATHPTVVALSADAEHGRCVVLQRINDSRCWMMTSNQLLPSFTNEDLKWLGQLAKHVNE